MLFRAMLILTVLILISGCQAPPNNQEKQTVLAATESTIYKEAIPPVANHSYEGIPIIMYALPDDVFKMPRTAIPYYRNGEISFLPEYVFTQHDEGHQPWLSNGLDVVTTATSNLTGETAPFMGTYEIEFKAPTDSSVLFISKITLFPE